MNTTTRPTLAVAASLMVMIAGAATGWTQPTASAAADLTRLEGTTLRDASQDDLRMLSIFDFFDRVRASDDGSRDD
jgi:hypothetical protein